MVFGFGKRKKMKKQKGIFEGFSGKRRKQEVRKILEMKGFRNPRR